MKQLFISDLTSLKTFLTSYLLKWYLKVYSAQNIIVPRNLMVHTYIWESFIIIGLIHWHMGDLNGNLDKWYSSWF